ncbi:BRCT domain protein [Aspergillus mulundensis]|uniref:BRCT protein n=1 Tax=Aspergillus mulundensis TaxID=1810919 RepID=A0A3D8QNX1_9EURO|nr:BRCT protein [Aspergillus mulundensis]RDW63154.1 BRCT protein [Aspergillus mulundensis]
MAGQAASNKERPLAGAVLCFTSVLPELRTELASIASQMGAGHSYDLTSEVTHLLVGETSTEKYKFVARERSDVVVLRPEWVEAVRQSWMQGGDTNMQALEEEYKLPTFAGTAICITGFEDLELRNYIRNNAQLHGADFRKDLTKTVTHLIARTAVGDKYKYATQWNVKVVTLKWFTDCIERGMVLEETLYHPLLPAEQQGAGAWNRSIPAVKHKAQETESSAGPRPRKLRRIASTKLSNENENIWGDIIGMGFETAEPKPSREERQASNEQRQKNAPVLQIAKSFASETTFARPSQPREPTAEPVVDHRNGFLDGCFFLIHGFSSKQTNVLRNHLSFNGAQLVDSLSEFSRPDIPKKGRGLYIIVPYKSPRSTVPSTDDLAFECEIVTDMWLERCLDTKSLVSPESHIANTPIPSFPVKGLSDMNICSTGFSRMDLLHLSKLVNLVGATYNEYLKPTASVLICNASISLNHEKLRHTHEWGVPAVTAEWLWSSIRQEKKQPFEPYLVRKPSTLSSKDPELRAGSRPSQKRPSQQKPMENTVPNKSNSLDTDSLPKEPKQTISESPQKAPPPRSNPNPKSQQQSISPAKPPPAEAANAVKSPAKRKYFDEEAASSTKTAIDSVVNGLLKHARNPPSRSNSDSTSDPDRPRSRRARPLLGRVQSNSSIRATDPQRIFSRASSIDTINGDGPGSAAESMSMNTDGGIPSLGTGSRIELEYLNAERDRRLEGIEEEEPPPMTQLDYEDPDAALMRAKFLRDAGKVVEKPAGRQDPVVDHLKELESAGWGTGRRTRNAARSTAVGDDVF